MPGWKEELLNVPVREIHPNPFSGNATSQSIQHALDNIQIRDHWSLTFGALRGHNTTTIDAVCRLNNEGVRRWRFDIDWKDIVTLFPTATPSTWWIMLYSEDRADKKLYSSLALCAKFFHPYVWRARACQKVARGLLLVTARQTSMQGCQDTREQLAACDAYARGTGRIDG